MPRLSKSPATPPKASPEPEPKPCHPLPPPSTPPTTQQAHNRSQALPTTPAQDPRFLCTICWQQQFAPSTPKLLGAASRIVCRACWKAVLDLSICWVCGECIVRGDEVVSLGWCFWHRACFGCLVCGVGMEVGAFEDGVGRWGARGGEGSGAGGGGGGGGGGGERIRRRRRRLIGLELETVPLCVECEVETARAPYMEVGERGLETVSRFDGGLSRDRLDMLSEEKEQTKRRSRRKSARFRGSSGLERELKRYINGSTSRWSEFAMTDDREARVALIKHAAEMGVSEDGHIDDEHVHSDSEIEGFGNTNEDSPPHVYVSVLDPVGEPALKPSKIKPLPKWMSLLPNKVHRERDLPQKASTVESNSHSHEIDRLDARSSPFYDCCPVENDNEDTPTPSSESTPRALSRSSTAPTSASIDIPEISKAAREGRDDNPKREHALGDVDHRESIYITPPEYASGFPSARQSTPCPTRRLPSVTKSDTTSPFGDGTPEDIPRLAENPCFPLGVDSTKSSPPSPPDERSSHSGYVNLPSDGSSRFVAQSSEYLERYQPKSAETKYERYVAKEREPVIERIRRQRVGKRSLGEIAAQTVERRSKGDKKMKLENEEYGLVQRREDLKKELRTLFCEE